MPDLTSLLAAFLALGGVNIFLTAVINLLKYFKVVADGQAGTWALVINAVLFLAYVGGSVAGVDLTKLDSVDRKSTRLNSSHIQKSRMPSSA